MVEGRGRGEKRANGLGRSSSNSPRLFPQNGVAASSATSCSLRPPNKTQQAPDFFFCHGCARRFPSDEEGGDHLVHLRSQWRVVLLCGVCLASVKSAAVCSYCFSPVADSERCLFCPRCSCRVHLRCGDLEHRSVDPWRLNPRSFICIDCCAIPKRCGRSLILESRICQGTVATESSFVAEKADTNARFREDGFEKITADKGVAERASYASGVVSVTKQETPERNTYVASCTDEEIALQLHLAINGSRRISRSSGGASLDLKLCANHGDQIGRAGNLGGRKFCKTVDKCLEDKFSEVVTATTEFCQGSNGTSCSKDKKLMDDDLIDGQADMTLIEDQGSSSSKVVKIHSEDHDLDCIASNCERKKECASVLYPSICRRDVLEKTELLQKDDISIPDKYLKKYSRRRLRLKGLADQRIII
ncbi:uncharacterized protein LOC122005284 [Zingiber officinale]|nr:uncharacterized protein LOC122005284 [Zingiber officinale]